MNILTRLLTRLNGRRSTNCRALLKKPRPSYRIAGAVLVSLLATTAPLLALCERDGILEPLAITRGPQSQTAVVGCPVTFTVSASGCLLQYQWLKDGQDIAGATSASLTLQNVSLTDAGTYCVRVTGGNWE